MAKYLFYDEDGAKCEGVENWKTFTFLLLVNGILIFGVWYFCHSRGWL